MDVTPGSRTRLDSYVDRYAARTHGMTASEIRALFAVASRPEVVSLAGGMPNISGLPLDVVGAAIGDLVAQRGPVALQYSSGQGDPTLREQICDVMALEGIDAHPDDVVVTVGSQQAVDLVTRVFCDPGDVVICEAPSYVGALGVFKAFQCQVVHAEMDEDGLVPDALRQAITTTRAAGGRIKFLYTIPNFHNPAGVTMSVARRAEILDICRSEGVLVLEDNPYGLLGFDSEPMRALAGRRERGRGLPRLVLQDLLPRAAGRLGAGPARRPREAGAGPGVGDAVPAGVQPDGRLGLPRGPRLEGPDQAAARDVPRAPRRDDRGAHRLHAGRLPVERPARRLLRLDDPAARASTRRRCCRARSPPGSPTCPGRRSSPTASASSSMRLSFCYPTPERIREGVRRLAGVLEEEMELRATFGATHCQSCHPAAGTTAPDRTSHDPSRPRSRRWPVPRAGRLPAVRPPRGRGAARRRRRGGRARRRRRPLRGPEGRAARVRRPDAARRERRGRRRPRGPGPARDPVRRRRTGRLPHRRSTSRSPSPWSRKVGITTPDVGVPAARGLPRAGRRRPDGAPSSTGWGCRSWSSRPRAARRWAARSCGPPKSSPTRW